MLASLLIVFREVLEAGLIVGIVLAATEGIRGRGWWIAGGIGAGVLGAFPGMVLRSLSQMQQVWSKQAERQERAAKQSDAAGDPGTAATDRRAYPRDSARSRIFRRRNRAVASQRGLRGNLNAGWRYRVQTLNAEQELLQAQVNEVQAHHDEIVAAYQLLNATGQLTAQYLALPVELYDPTAHYEEVRDSWVGFGDRPDLIEHPDQGRQ